MTSTEELESQIHAQDCELEYWFQQAENYAEVQIPADDLRAIIARTYAAVNALPELLAIKAERDRAQRACEQMGERIAELAKERERRVEWQPIETAPRDGTRVRILSADGAEEDNVYWSEERYCILGAPQGSRGPGWVSTEAGNLPIDPPTHWQPIPRPPATQHEDTP